MVSYAGLTRSLVGFPLIQQFLLNNRQSLSQVFDTRRLLANNHAQRKADEHKEKQAKQKNKI